MYSRWAAEQYRSAPVDECKFARVLLKSASVHVDTSGAPFIGYSAHTSLSSPNGKSIGSATFAQAYRQTTLRATSDSIRSHLAPRTVDAD